MKEEELRKTLQEIFAKLHDEQMKSADIMMGVVYEAFKKGLEVGKKLKDK